MMIGRSGLFGTQLILPRYVHTNGAHIIQHSIKQRVLIQLPACNASPALYRPLGYDWLTSQETLEERTGEKWKVAPETVHKTCLLLHGLLGSGRSWKVFLQRFLVDLHKHYPSLSSSENVLPVQWKFLLPDLRHHHRSSHKSYLFEDDTNPNEQIAFPFTEDTPSTLQDCVDDLNKLCKQLEVVPDAIFGKRVEFDSLV